ncbi:MAG: DUF4157 domain-containing protein [Bacteroidota bacterium]
MESDQKNRSSEKSQQEQIANAESIGQDSSSHEQAASLTPPPFQLKSSAVPPVANETGMTDSVKAKMERSFGEDFSDVTIQKNSTSAENLGALAYTQGTEIHFAPGEFDQSSEKGQELLGHELAHVVQQKQGRVHATHSEQGKMVNDDGRLESEADRNGLVAARGGKVQSSGNSTGGKTVSPVQRKTSPIQMNRPLPGPDELDGSPRVHPGQVFEAVMAAAYNAKGGHANHARSALEARLMVPISRATRGDLSPIPINVYNTDMFNHTWTGNIMFYMGNTDRPLGTLNENVGTGGSAGTGSNMGVTTGTSNTNSASVTGGSESSAGIEGGGLSASNGNSSSGTVSASETTTRTEQTGVTGTGSRTSSSSSSRVVHRYSADVIVVVSITASYDVSANPLTWGGGLADAMDGSDYGSSSRRVGTLRYKQYGNQAG